MKNEGALAKIECVLEVIERVLESNEDTAREFSLKLTKLSLRV